jgi:hypothetical protein
VNLRLNNDVLTFINTIAEIVHSQVHSWGGQCNKNLGNAFVIVWRIGDEETLIAANSASILTRKKTTRSTKSVENMTVATEGSPSLRSYSSRRKWTSGSSDHSDSPSQKSKNSRLNSPSPGSHHHHNGSSYDDSFSQQDPDENDSQVAHSPIKSRKNVHIDLRRVPGVDQIADGALIGYLKVIADINRSPEVLKYRSDPRLTLSHPPPDSSVDHHESTHPVKPHLSIINPSSLKTIFGSDEDDMAVANGESKAVVSVEERISNFFNNANRSSVFPNDSPVVNVVVSQQRQEVASSVKKKIDEEKKKEEFKVRMGFGLHAGWAIEGAVGSIYKVDATYLSPHVNMAARLETSSKQYQVPLLMSHLFHELLSEIPQKKCRKVDVVTVKGSEVPIGIYTYDCFQDQIFLENNTSSSVPLTARTLHKLMSAAGMVKGGHHNSSSRKIANRRSRANSAEGRESPVTADNNNNIGGGGSSSRGNSPVVPRVSTPTGPGPRASTPDLKKIVTFSSASGEEKAKTTTSITNTADGKGSPISISLKNINDPVDNSTKSVEMTTQASRPLPSLPSPPVLIGNRIKTMSIDEGGDDTSLLSSSPSSPVSPSSRLIYSKGVRDSETRKAGMSNSLSRSFANDSSSPLKPFSPPISPIAAGGLPPVPFLDLGKNLSRETDNQDNGSDSSPFPLKNSSSLEFDLTPRPTGTTTNNRNESTARESLLKSHSEEPKEDPSSFSSSLPERKKLPLPPMPSGENSAKTRLLLSQVHKELVLKKPSSSSSSSPSHAKRGSVASNHSAGSSSHSHRRASHYHSGNHNNNGAKLPLPPLSTQHSPTARLFLGQVHKELKKIQKEVDRRKSELSQKRHKKRSVFHSSGEEGGLEEEGDGEQEEEEEEINYGDIEDYLKKLFPDSELVIPQMIDEKDGLSFSEIFLKDTDLLQLRSHLNDRFYEIFSLGVNDYIKGNWSQAKLFLEDANQLREECVRHFMKTPLFCREEGKGAVEKSKERKKKTSNKKSSEELDSLLQVVNHRRQSQRSSMRMSTTAGSSSLDLPPIPPSNNNNSNSSSAVRRTSLLKAALLPPLPSKKTGETEVEREREEENENNYNRPYGDGPSQTLLRYMKGFNFIAPADWQGFRPLTAK